jgi:hypothetical protein
MINQHKVGLMMGSFAGLWHLVWSLLVAIGLAQPLLDFIFNLHMIDNPVHVQSFDIMHALLLIVVTAAVGYVGGYVLATLWNYYHKA